MTSAGSKIGVLRPGTHTWYISPHDLDSSPFWKENLCLCNTVYYSLLAACATCQIGERDGASYPSVYYVSCLGCNRPLTPSSLLPISSPDGFFNALVLRLSLLGCWSRWASRLWRFLQRCPYPVRAKRSGLPDPSAWVPGEEMTLVTLARD